EERRRRFLVVRVEQREAGTRRDAGIRAVVVAGGELQQRTRLVRRALVVERVADAVRVHGEIDGDPRFHRESRIRQRNLRSLGVAALLYVEPRERRIERPVVGIARDRRAQGRRIRIARAGGFLEAQLRRVRIADEALLQLGDPRGVLRALAVRDQRRQRL